jgi:hypothetical protein
LHRSCYAGIAIQELWHTSCHTEFLTQEFLHRIPNPGDLLVSETYPAPTSQVLLNFLLWQQGQLGGSLRNVTLCETCGEMRILWVWRCPSARNEDESHQLVLTSSFETSDATLSHKWRSNGKNWCKNAIFKYQMQPIHKEWWSNWSNVKNWF